jgi:hypothetical protein
VYILILWVGMTSYVMDGMQMKLKSEGGAHDYLNVIHNIVNWKMLIIRKWVSVTKSGLENLHL